MSRASCKFIFFLVFALLISIYGCNDSREKDKIREIVLPDELDIIELGESKRFDKNWYTKKFKVVAFIKNAGPYSTLNLDWQSAISDFPDVAFLFYVSENDTTKLINHLKEVNFTHPVIHDPTNEFRKLNVKDDGLTFICFLVKNNQIVGMGNPSIPDFKLMLNELINDSK